jgi:hypothetical protein
MVQEEPTRNPPQSARFHITLRDVPATFLSSNRSNTMAVFEMREAAISLIEKGATCLDALHRSLARIEPAQA